jgi:hypothetical protein
MFAGRYFGFARRKVTADFWGWKIGEGVSTCIPGEPIGYADRVARFMHASPSGKGNGSSILDFLAWEEQTSGFEELAGYDFGGPGVQPDR